MQSPVTTVSAITAATMIPIIIATPPSSIIQDSFAVEQIYAKYYLHRSNSIGIR